MNTNNQTANRKTAADELFDLIRSDIHDMRLLPGTKISEAEIAKQYDTSRQPVREAFIRLDNLSLLQIRPQKATIVRRISKSDIQQTRFVRAAVEIEVARKACQIKGTGLNAEINNLVSQQAECLKNNDIASFHELDIKFHASICRMAKCEFAIEVIVDCKAKLDRLCMLSLTKEDDAALVYKDHLNIAEHMASRDEDALVLSIREHLSRLDNTIEFIQLHHDDYFDQ